jgi:single-strand DNA-binding protein
MTNEAIVSVAGYIATDPLPSTSKTGTPMLKMRLAWTPRRLDRETNQWVDQPTCFAWVKCWRRLAENVNFSMNKGDPIVVSGTLTISEYVSKEGARRTSVEITATAIGHDLSRGITAFRRQRPGSERTAEDPQSGSDGAEVDSDHAVDPEADSVERAEIGSGDLPEADLDGGDEPKHFELVAPELAGSEPSSPDGAADGSEEEALESASAR